MSMYVSEKNNITVNLLIHVFSIVFTLLIFPINRFVVINYPSQTFFWHNVPVISVSNDFFLAIQLF